MEQPVTYARDGEIGVIRVDHPPVNALSQAVRAGLLAALQQGLADPEAKALVLYGAGRTFMAGADIKEFGRPPAEPTLRGVIAAYEASSKPIVAALHGTALGGGLELAMGCHYRVALAGSKVGLPEVKLGILPGAGGTQRLPRLAGLEAALDLITSGRFAEVDEALRLGIVDAIDAGSDARAAGLGYARRLVAAGATPRRTSALDDKLAAAPSLFDEARKRVAQRQRGRFSPQRCVDAVEAAATLPFEVGLKRERELFDLCMASPQRTALIHVFFGERAVAKVPDLDEALEPRPIARTAVIGAGTMGGGIAMCLANAGLPVTLVETSQAALDRGLGRIRANYETSVKRGSVGAAEMAERLVLIQPTLDFAAAGPADLIIEAVFEDMTVKREVFGRLDGVAKPGAVLATNTSYLDVNAIAAATARPQDVLGLHFFSPANVMRLLEVVRAAKTSGETLKTALAFGRRIGKVAVVAGVCDGFIGNRMLKAYVRQAFEMLEDGCVPAEIDAAITAFGFPMGPFAVNDLAGLDISYANRRREDAVRDPADRYVALADKLVEMGRLGQKSGAGWYRYETGDRTPRPDPAVTELILAESAAKGIRRRSFTQEEILTRALTALVNEGARILEEGIAARAIDIDMVWINGYGFPAHEGGPLFWADARGLGRVLEDVRRFAAADPRGWRPAPLLERLAGEGKGFKDWSRE